jgi:hypothetical protein
MDLGGQDRAGILLNGLHQTEHVEREVRGRRVQGVEGRDEVEGQGLVQGELGLQVICNLDLRRTEARLDDLRDSRASQVAKDLGGAPPLPGSFGSALV